MEQAKLGESEYRLMNIIWEDNPISSAQLAQICEDRFKWKKPTVYTMLKRMETKGYLVYENKMVTALVEREKVNKSEGEIFLDKVYGGSLPNFIAAFLKNQKLSKEDVRQIREMIEEAEDEE